MHSGAWGALVLSGVCLVLAGGCGFQKGEGGATPGVALPLSTRGFHLVDAQGRTVILRGVNYNGIESMLFTDQPPLPSDFQQIRRWGFNVIRFPISWEFVEPARDVYDEDYLTNWVEPVLDFAAAAGMGVILNLSQWNWSTCFSPESGRGNGTPVWALPPWARDDCPITGPQAFNQMLRASADFWLDMEVREQYMEVWEFLARRYRNHPAVIAYDLFNEPQPGDIWSAHPAEFDEDILQPFYEQLLRRIRAVDPVTLIIYECNIMHDVYPNFFTRLPFANLLYSSHLYTGGTQGGSGGVYTGPAVIQADVEKSVLEAQAQGVPLYIGEFGVGSAVSFAPLWMHDMFRFQEMYLVPAATWWGLRQHDNDTHGLTRFDTREEKPALLDYVSRPFPAATAGDLYSYAYDESTKSFVMTFGRREGVSGETLVSIPRYQYPGGIRVECSDKPGTWSYAYDPEDGYLRLSVNPASPVHTLHVLPAE